LAERRMFSKTIIDSDAFLSMPMSTQALYFHLAMRADDDGFVNSPRKIARMVGAADDDMRILITKRYILAFESGVIVIKHWRLHNYIRKDRYNETLYLSEKASLFIKKNGAYTDHAGGGVYKSMAPGLPVPAEETGTGQPMVDQRLTQDRLGKDRLGEDSQVEDRENTGADAPPLTPKPEASEPENPPRRKYGEYGWVLLTDEQHERLVKELGEVELRRCIKYVDESAQSSGNKNRWKDWNLVVRRCSREGWGRNVRQSRPATFNTLGALNEMMEENR
jgi:hypothetical protein